MKDSGLPSQSVLPSKEDICLFSRALYKINREHLQLEPILVFFRNLRSLVHLKHASRGPGKV